MVEQNVTQEMQKVKFETRATDQTSQAAANQARVQPHLVSQLDHQSPASPSEAKQVYGALAVAAKNNDKAQFVEVYGQNTALQPPQVADKEFDKWRVSFLQNRDALYGNAGAEAANQGRTQDRDYWMKLGKQDSAERATLGETDKTGQRKSQQVIESEFLYGMGSKITNETAREDMLRAAQQMGYSNEAIRSSGEQLSVSPSFLDSLVGPALAATAMQQQLRNTLQQMRDTEDAREDERAKKELEKELDKMGIKDPETREKVVGDIGANRDRTRVFTPALPG